MRGVYSLDSAGMTWGASADSMQTTDWKTMKPSNRKIAPHELLPYNRIIAPYELLPDTDN